MSNQSTDVVYNTFKDYGIHLPLVLLMSVKSSVCLAGIVLNLGLVFITYKNKSLRGSCNLQIAINALSMAIQQSSAFVTLGVVTTGINFIPLLTCGIIQTIPFFCTIFTNGNALMIGMDRMLSVLFPVWFKRNNSRSWYLICVLTVCFFYAGTFAALGLYVSILNPQIPVMCTVIDPVQRYATYVVITLLFVNSLSVFCYLVVWAIMQIKKNTNKTQVSIFKSLFIILTLEICGWITNYTIRLILNAANIHALKTWYIVNWSTIAPYLAMTLSPVVLFTYSKEYRKALKRQFKIIPTNNQIAIANTTVMLQHRHKSIGNLAEGSSQAPVHMQRRISTRSDPAIYHY